MRNDTIQPDGPSFTTEGHRIDWQKGQYDLLYTREGLDLDTIGYEDKGKVRDSLSGFTIRNG